MNKVIMIGNLVDAPELHTAQQSGTNLANFRLAVQRRMPNAQGVREADFFDCVAFAKTADFCAKYLTRGTRVAIEGRLQSRTYTTQDGAKRYAVDIAVDTVEFAGAKPENAAQSQQQPSQQPGQFTEVDDDPDLPF